MNSKRLPSLRNPHAKSPFMHGVKNDLSQNMKPPQDPFIMQVLELMNQNLQDEDFQLRQVWRELGMSRAQSYRKFCRSKFGNPAACLLKLRLERAASLLLHTGLNVSEIAYDVGFKNASHFTRVFSLHFGKTPGDFRKKH